MIFTTSARGTDVLFSGQWWWVARRWLAGRYLAAVLARYGDSSLEAKRATDDYKNLDFAVRYWRRAPGPVQQVIRRAAKQGVPVWDLQLITLSNDLRAKGGIVTLRRSAVVRVLSILASIVVVAGWLELSIVTMAQKAGPLPKVLVILVVTLICVLTWRGWSLWLGRPERVIDRWTALIKHACEDASSADVVPLLVRKPNHNAGSPGSQ